MHKLFASWFYDFDKRDEIPGFVVCSYLFCGIVFLVGILALNEEGANSSKHILLNSINFFAIASIGLMSLVYKMKLPVEAKEAVFGFLFILVPIVAVIEFISLLVAISPLLALGLVSFFVVIISFAFLYTKSSKEG